MNQNRLTYDIQRRKERMTNYFMEQQQFQDFTKPENPVKILNPNKAPQQLESPLVNQVKFYFQSRVNRLEFTQLFEGRESFTQMFVTILSTTLLILVVGFAAYYLNYIGKTFICLVMLVNGFHVLGLHVFYFSKNSDKALAYFFIVLILQFLLCNQLWGGGLLNNIFTTCYVVYNGYKFIRQLPVSPPSYDKLLHTSTQFFFYALMVSLKPTTISKRIINFLFFLIPVYIFIFLIDFFYQQQRITTRKILLAGLLDLILQFSEGMIIIYKKYYVFNLSRKADQLPLFIYPLCLQNNQQQEIASINYVNSINNDDKVFNLKMLFRLEGCQPPTIADIMQSYYYEKLKQYVQEIQTNFSQISKLLNEKNKVRTLFEDITLPFTFIKYYYMTYRIKRQQRQLIKLYYFIFKSFDSFQKESQYEVECLRFNVQLISTIQQNQFEEPKILNICKKLAKISERHMKHEIFQLLLS
ncbi:unnamed protein product (macronuclear) [Paramecium tetraurelia]|uniref:Transmembrane protein n=1 Tax=Paramecium tetraurelia TaxID=5888 RepID=A0BR69_PARTE|nr:uncharacterized protein GSPATT00031266001 [Paramecium tetraurelia]CAK61036.1 unnamed protein product [Paramecium tetraurelia]|eukprot:XP_001428434.1 hypothetical protein (macronuclear) [Paramecium tetraurelia strain d4-2]